MDEPVPVRRAAVGCLLIAAAVVVVALLVRPTIFSLAPPRDDAAVVVGTVNELGDGPAAHEVVLSRAYGWAGERDAGDNRVQLTVIVAPSVSGGPAAVAAASPLSDDCAVEIAGDRLTDCEGRAWTVEGLPLDSAHPPLDRFPVTVDSGSVVVDFTRSLDE